MNELAAVRPILHQIIAVRVPGRPPTANARRHWRRIAQDNAEWLATARKCADEAKGLWEARHGLRWLPVRLASLEVTFGLHTKAHRDFDNLICSIKPELDGLVASGLLIDDSIDVIASISFGWRYSKGEPFTEFLIEEAGAEGGRE